MDTRKNEKKATTQQTGTTDYTGAFKSYDIMPEEQELKEWALDCGRRAVPLAEASRLRGLRPDGGRFVSGVRPLGVRLLEPQPRIFEEKLLSISQTLLAKPCRISLLCRQIRNFGG